MSENKIVIKSGELRKLEILERLVDMTDKTEQSVKLGTISNLSNAIGFINTNDGCGIQIFGNDNSITDCRFEGINTGVSIKNSDSNMICNSIFNNKSKYGFEVQGNINIKGSGDAEMNDTGIKVGATSDEDEFDNSENEDFDNDDFEDVKNICCPNCNRVLIDAIDMEHYKSVKSVVIECDDCGMESEYAIPIINISDEEFETVLDKAGLLDEYDYN